MHNISIANSPQININISRTLKLSLLLRHWQCSLLTGTSPLHLPNNHLNPALPRNATSTTLRSTLTEGDADLLPAYPFHVTVRRWCAVSSPHSKVGVFSSPSQCTAHNLKSADPDIRLHPDWPLITLGAAHNSVAPCPYFAAAEIKILL